MANSAVVDGEKMRPLRDRQRTLPGPQGEYANQMPCADNFRYSDVGVQYRGFWRSWLSGPNSWQGVQVQSGDVLLVRTGYGAIWRDEAEYLEAAGVAKSGTLWAAEQGVVAVGADNMAWDVPKERDPDTGATLFAHMFLLPKRGIYILENVNLEELARDRCWTFAFVGVPLKLVGATGSPLRPLALA